MMLNRSPGFKRVSARFSACFACTIDGPDIEPEVSMTKMTSLCRTEAVSLVGGINIIKE